MMGVLQIVPFRAMGQERAMAHDDRHALETLLASLAKKRGARFWFGERPDVRDGQVPLAIAAMVGLPDNSAFPVAAKDFREIDRKHAAQLIAFVAKNSLAYPHSGPRESLTKEIADALAALGPDARFVANSAWSSGASSSWLPLTDSTFDAGLIGYDSNAGFIFWVEEED